MTSPTDSEMVLPFSRLRIVATVNQISDTHPNGFGGHLQMSLLEIINSNHRRRMLPLA
jgi:hypothetical protein